MRMLMMNIWVMGMLVVDDFMSMPMHMRRRQIHSGIVLMLMMFIMRMCMCVFKWLMGMFMRVILSHMQPHTYPHQR